MSKGTDANASAETSGNKGFLDRLHSDDWSVRTTAVREARISGTPAALPILVKTIHEEGYRRPDVPPKSVPKLEIVVKNSLELLVPPPIFELLMLGAAFIFVQGITVFGIAGVGKLLGALGLSMGTQLVDFSKGADVLWFWLGVFALIPVAFVWSEAAELYSYLRIRGLDARRTQRISTCGLFLMIIASLGTSVLVTDSFFYFYAAMLLCVWCTGLVLTVYHRSLTSQDDAFYSGHNWNTLYGYHALAAVSEITRSVSKDVPHDVCPICLTPITSHDDPEANIMYFHCQQCGRVYDGSEPV